MQQSFSFIKIYLRNLPIIILCILVAVIAAQRYIGYMTPMYESTAKLKLADVNEGVPSNNLFKDLDVFVSQTKIATEIEVIKSSVLINKVIEKINFGQSLYRAGNIRNTELYENSPIDIAVKIIDSTYFDVEMYIDVVDTNTYIISIPEKNIYNLEGKMEESLESEGAHFLISINKENLVRKPNTKIVDNYKFIKKSNAKLVEQIQSNLDVIAVEKDIPVVRINFKSSVPKKAAVLVNALAQTYIDDYIQVKYQAARTTTQFLDVQIKEVTEKLSNSENQIQGYRDQNNIINIHQETETDLRQLAQLKIQQTNVKMNLEAIQELNAYVKNGKSNFLELAPNFESFTDLLSTEMIKKIKQLQSEKKDLMLTLKPNDDRVKLIDKKISDYTDYLVESVNNTENNLKTKFSNLSRDIASLEKEFIGLPEKEKLMNSMNRDFEIYQGSYNFLTNKKIEAQIAQNAKISFHRILSPAQIAQKPISPNKIIIIALSAILGMFVGIFIIFMIDAWQAKVKDISSIEENSLIPIALTTPLLKSEQGIKTHFLKSAQLLSIKNIFIDRNTICFTSEKETEGRSFHIYQFAKALATQEKSVLIIDINGQLGNHQPLATNVAAPSKIKNLSYLSVASEDIYTKSMDYLDHWMNEWNRQYDIVLINNEAMSNGLVSQTMVHLADTNLLIIDGVSSNKKAIQSYGLLGCPNPFFVINRYMLQQNYAVQIWNNIQKSLNKDRQSSYAL